MIYSTSNGYSALTNLHPALENIKPICDKETENRKQQLYALQHQKPNGKSARREQPTYDNNPRVTLEFLERLRAGSGNGLVFQNPGEEYSPWQRDQTPPPRKVQEERPTTFAEAVRHKLNATNGTSGTQGATKGTDLCFLKCFKPCSPRLVLGPVKAKLVARASAPDMSPWKMNKSAPRTLADSVPVALRPLLSYTLWRLYEERNSQGVGHPCMLLTNDVATYNVAQTLTIDVGSISQIRLLIASQTEVEDVESFGELEREFGRRAPLPKRDPNGPKLEDKVPEANNGNMLNGGIGDHKGIADDEKGSTGELNGDVDKPESQVVVHPINNGDLPINLTEAGVPEITSHITKMEEPSIVTEDQNSVQEWLTKADPAVHLLTIEDTEKAGLEIAGLEKPVHTLHDVEAASTPSETETVEKLVNNSTSNYQQVVRQGIESQLKEEVVDTPIKPSDLTANGKPAPMNFANGISKSTYNSPERNSLSPQRVEAQNQQCSSPSAASSGSMPCSPRPSSETNSLSTAEAQEPEDSDEEVVVFNPRAKRWSSQSKPVRELPQPKSPAKPLISRTLEPGFESPPRERSSERVTVTPSPSGQAQTNLLPPNKSPRNQKSGEQSPRGQVSRDQAHREQGSQKHSPRNMSPRNHSPRNQVQRRQGRPNQTPPNRAPPAIIDPDFFGRSPVVKLNPGGHNGQGRYFPHGGPRRGPRGHEADVEYVVTSGTTREAARGKGKLWVP